MIVSKTFIDGLLIVEPRVFNDGRGYFFERYQENEFKKAGITNKFVQDNLSYSKFGCIRGLHFQTGKYAQAKLVSVPKGKILDVVVDIRKNSETFGQFETIEISDENKKSVFIPGGFAHGFSVLSEEAIVVYKVDKFYEKETEKGIIYNDPDLNINWEIPQDQIIISDKDQQLDYLKNIELS
ncbi:MAG: dTDP-4-dehydrorhamnose 3,5-epimerase [Legionellales bacterium]|nr:dTDP-4-dehydrorhamnose 3,5-epimerase [Legionellales bacterium]